MGFDLSTASHLKPWLVRTLEPICDAEPGALADYILALLKHNVPESEMRKELTVQLEEFLEKETSSFIDTLFTVLRTKSYLPYTPTPSSPSSFSPNPQSMDTGIPIPLDAFMASPAPTSPSRGQKRSIDNDERDGRPPAKGLRVSSDGQFSRYQNERGGGSTGAWGGRGGRQGGPGVNGRGEGMHMGGGMNGVMGHMNGRPSQQYLPPDQKRGICRDYYNNGYCARGALCKFSHGEDALIPNQMFPMNGGPMAGPSMSYMPMFPNGNVQFGMGGGGSNAPYDPHEARMDMRPTAGGSRPSARAPILPRMQNEDGSQIVHSPNASGELPVIQDLTPNLPPEEIVAQDAARETARINGEEVGNSVGVAQPPRPIDAPMDVDMGMPMGQPMHARGGGGGRGRMRGGRGYGGTFGGEVHNFRPERRNDKTLVVEKIPEDKLSLDAVNSWFKRFGTVTNVAIDAVSAKALVSFSHHDEAHAAWKSEDAVFNNRFVKLFWHRPLEGHGQVGARMLAASAPLVKNISTKESSPSVPPAMQADASVPVAVPSVLAPPRKPSTPSAAATALAAKQRLLEQQIAEQKSLMTQLGTTSGDEKKQIMARLRKLGEEMKPASSPSPAPSSSPAPIARKRSISGADVHEQRERERLDKELELHHATGATDGEPESTEDLKAKLARLKAEAASLGLPEAATGPSYPPATSTYRPYRGRGRVSRSFYRGAARGGPPRGSMKLDNRPKKLLVKGVGDDNVQAVRDWYETTGSMDSLETVDSGDIIVSFGTRAAAEQGFAKGHKIPPIGQVQVSWYSGQQPSSASTHKVISPSSEAVDGGADNGSGGQRAHSPVPELHHSPHMQEEEVVASGWGGDGDGEDGMGML